MINYNNAFIMYADCSVTYDGRACSTLDRGNYLIIRKQDGTLLIHGADKSPPKNYQGSGATLVAVNDGLLSIRKKEKIKIELFNIINFENLSDWSNNAINIRKTEAELVNKIVANSQEYLNVNLKSIEKEFKTPHGPIDILGTEDNGTLHIVEVKRKTASLAHCSQLSRYMEVFTGNRIGYIASPDIGKNALRYLDNHDLRWIKVDFDA